MASKFLMEIGFSFGSNQGNRLDHLRVGRRRLLATEDATLLAASPLYETDPVGVEPEYADLSFVNAVLIIESEQVVERWLEWLHEIESDLGRQRTGDRNAPRPIDIDILYAGNQCIDSGGLVVPHPRWTERRFVLQPLADVRPDLVLPNQTRTVAELLATLRSNDGLERLEDAW